MNLVSLAKIFIYLVLVTVTISHIQIIHNIPALTKHALHYISCSLTQNNPETYKQMKYDLFK